MERQHQPNKFIISRQLLTALLLLVSFIQTGLAAQVESIAVISVAENRAHQKFISAFKSKLSQDYPGIDIVDYPLDEFDSIDEESLVLTLGSRAFKEIADESVPVFHALISNSLYSEYSVADQSEKYHLTFNQPLGRLLKLYSLALPDFDKVGVLVGNSYPKFETEINRQGKIFGKKIVTESVTNDFSSSLTNLLTKVDSLLLLPDSKAVNRSTINSLVLSSYNKKIPLVGYSKSLVKAGAMLSLHSTSTQLGRDAAKVIGQFASGKKIPFRNYPTEFEVSVNYKLSRVYGLSIPSEDKLHQKIIKEQQK